MQSNGIPILGQIINYLDRQKINRTACKNNSDRYYKKFKTYDHLVTMMYIVFSGCTSLREITSIMHACEGRLNHLGLKHFPKRSTVSDANKRRPSKVFGEIYFDLLNEYGKFISDSKSNSETNKLLKIVDSTTISLFGDILQGVGRNPIDGRKKGGIKMHTMINALEDVPCLVKFSSAKVHDHTFLKFLKLQKGSIVVFDKGYVDYLQYKQWTDEGIYYVTRLKDNANYESIEEFDIEDEVASGVVKDEKISVKKGDNTIEMRKVSYWHDEQKKLYEFITNNYDYSPDKVAEIYKQRWQIELLFKRLKQNFPLKYFLGDSQNAIEIQIWCSLIVQLLLLVIKKMAKRRWSFSNMLSIIRFHLMVYIDLLRFLNNPDGCWANLNNKTSAQITLFGG